MRSSKLEKERENIITKCKTILDQDKTIESIMKTDKTNISELTLKKKINEKTHKKYYSVCDRNKLVNSSECLGSNSKNKHETNKKFIENYTKYVSN